jgi:hypothetical protein
MSHRCTVAALVAVSSLVVVLRVPGDELPGIPEATYAEKQLFDRYADGKETLPRTKETDEFLDKMAKWFIYRVTKSDAVLTVAQRDQIVKDFDAVILRTKDPKAKDFVERFAPIATSRLKQLDTDGVRKSEIAVLYGAQLLPIAARLKHDSVDKTDFKTPVAKRDSIGDYLTDLLKDDSKGPVLHLYAARGLKEFFPTHHYLPDVFDAGEKMRKQRDAEHIDVLVQRIEGKWPIAKMDAKAIQFIRRDMIASLAEAQMPAIATFASGKDGFSIAEGSPAPTLLKVLTGQLDPEPDVFEKYHAALGVCKLLCAEVPLYQPEAGVYLVGEYLVEFSDLYNKEVNVLGTKTLPWKLYGETLKNGLDEMEKRTKGTSASEKVKGLTGVAAPIFTGISSYTQVAGPNLALRKYVASIRPKGTEVEIFSKVKKGPKVLLK